MKTDDSGEMLVAFTITTINYLVVSLFCDAVLFLSCLYWPAICIYIYIYGIKFFVCAIGLVSGRTTKAAMASPKPFTIL